MHPCIRAYPRPRLVQRRNDEVDADHSQLWHSFVQSAPPWRFSLQSMVEVLFRIFEKNPDLKDTNVEDMRGDRTRDAWAVFYRVAELTERYGFYTARPALPVLPPLASFQCHCFVLRCIHFSPLRRRPLPTGQALDGPGVFRVASKPRRSVAAGRAVTQCRKRKQVSKAARLPTCSRMSHKLTKKARRNGRQIRTVHDELVHLDHRSRGEARAPHGRKQARAQKKRQAGWSTPRETQGRVVEPA